MHPILLQIGPLKIPSYGFLMAVGFLLSFHFVISRAKDRGLDVEKVVNLLFIVLLSSIGGSRLLFVALRWERFIGSPLDVFKLWKGGLVFIGGLVTALVLSIWYCYRSGLSVGILSDVMAPFLAFGHVFGRLGCFANGCCYGCETDFFTGVHFPFDSAHVYRHPTQLYEAFAELLIFFVVNTLYKRYSLTEKWKPGSLLMVYVLLYSIFRFCNEFLRADDRGGVWYLGLSLSQNGTAALIGIVCVIFLYKKGTS